MSNDKPTADGMHIEYHTVNPKRDKPADCIFMIENRICNHPKSVVYDEKCYMASYCPYREKDPQKSRKKKEPKNSADTADKKSWKGTVPHKREIYKINCSIPLLESIENKSLGSGIFVQYENKRMTILYRGVEQRFVYPDAFLDGYLIADEKMEELIIKDMSEAIWK